MLFAGADLIGAAVAATWTSISNYFGSKARRDDFPLLDGQFNYGNTTIKHTQLSSGEDIHVYMVAHIPHNGTLRVASTLHLSHTWEHHALVYINDQKIGHLYHRLAHPEDLGAPNNGSVHQYRVQSSTADHPSPLSSVALARKRSTRTKRKDEAYEGAAVIDYAWGKNDDYGSWENWNGGGNAMGDKWAEKMQYHGWEATCASPGICTDNGNAGTHCATTWNGVLAYGWNEQAFNWGGRGEGWLDSCEYYCDTSKGDTCTLVGGNGV